MDARCNTFGMAFTLEVEWNWSIGDLMLYTSRMARVRPNTASAKELAEMKQDHVRGGHDEVWPAGPETTSQQFFSDNSAAKTVEAVRW
jgi:alpha-L-fucosidase